MKSKTKARPAKTTPSATPTSSWQKYTRLLSLIGGIVVAAAAVALCVYYWDVIWPTGGRRRVDGKSPADDPTPPELNAAAAPGSAPAGMVWVPGGEFWMGNDDLQDAGPLHTDDVDGFWMDQYEVTNAQFAEFVAATKYVTVAEQQPDSKEFPDVPADKLKPFSLVFKQLP